MASFTALLLLAAFTSVQGSALAAASRETVASREKREETLIQTWDKNLDSTDGTPISRVVGLLKEMQATLKKEMDEDEEIYEKLACWINNNKYEKNEAIEAAEKEIDRLTALIEQLTAKIAELKTLITETTKELEADKEELATATELRQKQLKEMHGYELDAIQNIENLKAAILVLGKRVGAALPQIPQISLLALDSSSSSLNKGKKAPGGGAMGGLDRELDAFMLKNDFKSSPGNVKAADHAVAKFLQEKPEDFHAMPEAKPHHAEEWSAQDKEVLARAMRTASVFMQTKGMHLNREAPAGGSAEILGIMKQLKEEMENDLSEGQKEEVERAAAFDELRAAKTDEIAAGEKLLEEKKEELANAEFDVANAKEDLEEIQSKLSEEQKFLMELTKQGEDAATAYEARKKDRLGEIQAVSATIEILTSDEARDAFNGAYKFIQMSMRTRRMSSRQLAAQKLRAAARKFKNPELSILATKVELDAFTKIKKMIEDLIVKLKTQQADEVKKNDWCKSEFQENAMETMKAEDLKKDQEVAIEDLGTAIKTLTDEVEAGKALVAQLQLDMQRAGEARVKENKDFQQTVADQVATQEILAKALDKLATFYDKLFLVQVGRHGHKADVKQAGHKASGPSAGASGVMSMIEKLIYDAKELEADSKKSEGESQAAYETFVSETNAAVGEAQGVLTTKIEELAVSKKTKVETEEALALTMTDLEDLSKYKAGLHEECDYILKNFGIRQESRQAEIESLQEAIQILSGAK